MAHVVVRDAFDVPQPHRQHRLGTLQGLYLALLVHTQHQRMIRRIQIQADDVAHLLDEERIGGELEALGAMRLQAEQRHVAVDGGGGTSCLDRQRAARPVRVTFRLARQDGVDQFSHLLIAGRARPAGLEFVMQAGNAALAIAGTPQRDRRAAHAIAMRDRRLRFTVGHAQDHLCAARQGRRQTLRSGHRLQLQTIIGTDNQRFSGSSHERALRYPRVLL